MHFKLSHYYAQSDGCRLLSIVASDYLVVYSIEMFTLYPIDNFCMSPMYTSSYKWQLGSVCYLIAFLCAIQAFIWIFEIECGLVFLTVATNLNSCFLVQYLNQLFVMNMKLVIRIAWFMHWFSWVSRCNFVGDHPKRFSRYNVWC